MLFGFFIMTMSSLKTSLLAIGSVALLGLTSASYAQHFYKWVDKNGSTHYTLTPPPKNAKKQGRIFTINDTPSGSQYRPPSAVPENASTTDNTPTQNNPNIPSADQPVANVPSVPVPTSTTARKGEHLALPPRIADPTVGQTLHVR